MPKKEVHLETDEIITIYHDGHKLFDLEIKAGHFKKDMIMDLTLGRRLNKGTGRSYFLKTTYHKKENTWIFKNCAGK